MAAITPDLGGGNTATTIISFDGTGTSALFARVLRFDWSGIHRDAVDTTTLATVGGKTFIPSDTYDPGQLNVEMQFDTDRSLTAITATAETVTITFSDGETNAHSNGGFLTDFAMNVDEGVMTATGTIKFSGSVNWS